MSLYDLKEKKALIFEKYYMFVIRLSNLFLIQSLWSKFLSPFDSWKTYTHKS